MLESDDNHLRRCHANSDSLRACITYITFLNIGRDKSLVDDLNMGQGIVSRGACLPCDPLRFSPCPEDLLRPQHLSPHPKPPPSFTPLPTTRTPHRTNTLFLHCPATTSGCAIDTSCDRPCRVADCDLSRAARLAIHVSLLLPVGGSGSALRPPPPLPGDASLQSSVVFASNNTRLSYLFGSSWLSPTCLLRRLPHHSSCCYDSPEPTSLLTRP